MTWQEVEAHIKIGIILKERDDGSVTVCFIVECLRSGVNSRVSVPERAPLPSPTMLFQVFGIGGGCLEPTSRTNEVGEALLPYMCVIHFSDAFYNLERLGED